MLGPQHPATAPRALRDDNVDAASVLADVLGAPAIERLNASKLCDPPS
jgi:hypothetical protein